jgi:zinc-ribbon domain
MSNSFVCPNCGADVPLKAKACPACGSDRETGWSEAAQYMHLLPDRGDAETGRAKFWRKPLIAAIALLLLVAFLAAQGLTWGWLVILVAVVGGGIGDAVRHRPSGLERQLYRQLLQRARGDRKLADRLIAYEKNRHPTSTRLQWLQNAIYQWDRDQ